MASKTDLEDIIRQLKEEIIRLRSEKKSEFVVDKDVQSAFGVAIKGGEYHVVEIAYNFKTGESQLLGSSQAKNPKNFHLMKIKLQDQIYEKIIKGIETLEA